MTHRIPIACLHASPLCRHIAVNDVVLFRISHIVDSMHSTRSSHASASQRPDHLLAIVAQQSSVDDVDTRHSAAAAAGADASAMTKANTMQVAQSNCAHDHVDDASSSSYSPHLSASSFSSSFPLHAAPNLFAVPVSSPSSLHACAPSMSHAACAASARRADRCEHQHDARHAKATRTKVGQHQR